MQRDEETFIQSYYESTFRRSNFNADPVKWPVLCMERTQPFLLKIKTFQSRFSAERLDSDFFVLRCLENKCFRKRRIDKKMHVNKFAR